MGEEVLNPTRRHTPLGRGIILSQSRDNHKNRIDHLPDTSCIFLRACFQSFHELRVSQDTTLLTHQPIGEPLVWRNNRFEIADRPRPCPRTRMDRLQSVSSLPQPASSPPTNIGQHHHPLRVLQPQVRRVD